LLKRSPGHSFSWGGQTIFQKEKTNVKKLFRLALPNWGKGGEKTKTPSYYDTLKGRSRNFRD